MFKFVLISQQKYSCVTAQLCVIWHCLFQEKRVCFKVWSQVIYAWEGNRQYIDIIRRARRLIQY